MTRIALATLCVSLAACAGTVVRPVKLPLPSSSQALGRAAVGRMPGCYVVDYNYHETRSRKADYKVDERVYDVNATKTVMEWIEATEATPTRIRLQHVLFALDKDGRAMPGSLIRHQAEDWEFEPAWVWEYLGQSKWRRVETPEKKGQWVRRITNLDDGLRYQCAAPWVANGTRAEWECNDNFAPIPGRETRDMKRKDYQAMLRGTRLIVLPSGWVERQKNVKTIVGEDGQREPLADEVARNWYVRASDAQCREAAEFTKARRPFWDLLKDTWASYFSRETAWAETPPGQEPRWARIAEIEEKFFASVAKKPADRSAAEKEIRAAIDADRR